MPPKNHAHQHGFTLLELMVALTIFALIGMGAHAMLKSVLSAREAQQKHAQQLTQLQKAIWIISHDLAQMDVGSVTMPAGTYTASFARYGWVNPLGLPRSDMLQVAYGMENHVLKRYYWSYEKPSTTAQVQPLLDAVENLELRFTSPREVELVLTTQQAGTIRRVIEVSEP